MLEMLKKLHEAGAEMDIMDTSGLSLIHLACEKGQLGVLNILIEAGADS